MSQSIAKPIIYAIAIVVGIGVAIGLFAEVFGRDKLQVVTGKYFDSMMSATRNGNYDKVMQLYDPLFFERTSEREWRKVLRLARTRLGAMKSHKMVDWAVWRNKGEVGVKKYTAMKFDVQYEKGMVAETLTFRVLRNNEEVKIWKHKIDSEMYKALG